MGAEEGVERGHADPAGEELGRGLALEAADVGAGESQARKPQVHQHGRRDAQILPGAAIVRRPGAGVALGSGIGRAAEDPVAMFRADGLQALVGGPRHLHPIGRMHLPVRRALALEIMLHHGRKGGASEDGGLVHVVPEAVETQIHQALTPFSPPLAHTRTGEIGEIAFARPHRPMKKLAIGQFAKDVLPHAVRADIVIHIHLDAGVDHGHGPEAIVMQVGDQPGQMGERGFIPGETAKAIHVIDIEVNGVAGDASPPEILRDFPHDGLSFIAPAGLVIAQHPQGWQIGVAREIRVASQHLLGLRAEEDIPSDFIAQNAVIDAAVRTQSELAIAHQIQQQAKGPALLHAQQKGDVDVERIVARPVALGVAGGQGVGATLQGQMKGPLAQSIPPGALIEGLGEKGAALIPAQPLCARAQGLTRRVRQDEPKGGFVDDERSRAGADVDAAVDLAPLPIGGLRRVGQGGVGEVGWHRIASRHPNAQRMRADDLHRAHALIQQNRQPVVDFLHACHRTRDDFFLPAGGRAKSPLPAKQTGFVKQRAGHIARAHIADAAIGVIDEFR